MEATNVLNPNLASLTEDFLTSGSAVDSLQVLLKVYFQASCEPGFILKEEEHGHLANVVEYVCRLAKAESLLKKEDIE